MTPMLVFCGWLVQLDPADIILVSMGLRGAPPCVPNEVPVLSYEHCMRFDLPAALRRLRAQYPAISGGCRP